MGFGTSAAQRENFDKRMASLSPINWWKCNEVSGTTIIDYGSAPKNFTLDSKGTVNQPGPNPKIPTNTSIVYDGAGTSFSGSTVGVATDFQFGTGSFTFGMFVRYVSVGTKGFHGNNKITTGAGWRLTLTCSSRIWGGLVSDGTGNIFFGSVTQPNDTNWHHVALVVDRSTNTARTVFDGVSYGSANNIAGKGAFDATSTIMSIISQNTTSDTVMRYAHIFIVQRALSDGDLRSLWSVGIRN